MISRRNLLFGAAAVAAPAIIRPGILMPVKAMLPDDGIRLYAAAHPKLVGWSGVVTRDLTEESLLTLLRQIYAEGRGGFKLRPTHIL